MARRWWPVLVVLMVGALPARAEIPRRINLQGVLRDGAGALQSGTFEMTFRLYDAPDATTPRWQEVQPAVAVDGGVFSTALGAEQPLPDNLFRQSASLWLGVTLTVDGVENPRLPLASVAYAFEALHATNAEDALRAADAVHAADAENAVHALNADDALHADDAENAVHALDADEAQHALNADNAQHADDADEALHALDADTLDGVPVDAFQRTIDVTAPLQLNGSTLSLVGCAPGQVLRFSGSAWVCDVDREGLTGAGNGLVVNGAQVEIAPTGVTTALLADLAVTDAKLADNAVTASKLLDGAVTGTKVAGDSLTGAHIVDGTVADADLSPNVALKDAAQTFTGLNQFTATGTGVQVTGTAVVGRLESPILAGGTALALEGDTIALTSGTTTRLTVDGTGTTVNGPLQLLSSAGASTLDAPASGGVALTLPASDGVAGAALITDGAGALAFKRPQTVETNATSIALTNTALTELTAVRTTPLTGDYLLMFSAIALCASATADGAFQLRRGATTIAGTQHSIIYVSGQRRAVAFQRYVTGLANEAISAWASMPTGGTTCSLEQVTLTAVER
ncbi:MAG: hypothetical protein AB2A00_10150 [Myxococcota bacterium]